MLNVKNINYSGFPGFGKRISIGNLQEPNYFQHLFNIYDEVEKKHADKYQSPAETEQTHSIIVKHIHNLHKDRGALNPTTEPVENLDTFIKQQPTTKPPGTISDNDCSLIKRYIDDELDIVKKSSNIHEKKFGSKIREFNKKLCSSKPSRQEFIDQVIEMNKFLANGVNAEINLESGILEELAKTNEPTVFVFNHPHPPYDMNLAFALIAKLYEAYQKANNTETCPLPKYIISLLNFKYLPPVYSKVFDTIETVQVNSFQFPTKQRAEENKKLAPIIEGFVKGENNIFTFPEGSRRRHEKDLPLEERFQYGTAKMIHKALNENNNHRVRVVSVGLDYKDGLGVIHLGKPLYLTKEGKYLNVSKGNIAPETEAANNNPFYRELSTISDNESIPVLYGGVPVEMNDDEHNKRFITRLITGILSTDLGICLKAAEKTLNENTTEYTEKISAISDFKQHNKELPSNGEQFCAPVSASNAIMWLSQNGFPRLTKGKTQLEVVKELGKYSNTNNDGTTVYNLCKGLEQFIKEKGYKYKRLEYQGYCPNMEYHTGQTVPELNWIQKAIEKKSIVLLNLGCYNKTKSQDGKDIYEWQGGHWVTAVGYINKPEKDGSNYLIVHDPAVARDPFSNKPQNDSLKLEQIPSGTLQPTEKNVESTIPHDAEGFYQITQGLDYINKKDFSVIIDGVVVLEMNE